MCVSSVTKIYVIPSIVPPPPSQSTTATAVTATVPSVSIVLSLLRCNVSNLNGKYFRNQIAQSPSTCDSKYYVYIMHRICLKVPVYVVVEMLNHDSRRSHTTLIGAVGLGLVTQSL